MSVFTAVVSFVGLVLATAPFVAAEFTFVATGRHRLEERAQAGDRRATHALAVQRRLLFMLSGAQLGITIAALLLGAIAEPTLTRADPGAGAVGPRRRASPWNRSGRCAAARDGHRDGVR